METMKLLFVINDGRLVAKSNEGKMYFPIRDGKIVGPGLYDCKCIIDKGKYGFVNGDPIKTYSLNDSINNADMAYMLCTCSVKYTIINGSPIYIINSSIMYVDENRIINEYAFNYNTVLFYTKYLIFSELSTSDIINTMCLPKFTIPNKLKNIVILQAIAILRNDELYYNIVSINALICHNILCLPFKYGIFTPYGQKYAIFIIDKNMNLKFISVETEMPTCIEYKCESIDIDDVIQYAIANHISIARNKTITRHIGENRIDVDTIPARDAIDITDEEKAKVEKSFESFYAFRKKYAKYVSKESLANLAKLTDKQILGFDFFTVN